MAYALSMCLGTVLFFSLCDALAALVAGGARASVILVVQRSDVEHGVRPSAFHDPAFAAAAVKAAQAGVQFRAVRASVDLQGTYLTHELPVNLSSHASATVLTDVGRQREIFSNTKQL